MALVRRFFDRINAGRFDDATDLTADDVLHHDIPLPEIRGRDAALTERVDVFTHQNGSRTVLPTMGSMRVAGGAITEWRDDFDLASFERQAAPMRD